MANDDRYGDPGRAHGRDHDRDEAYRGYGSDRQGGFNDQGRDPGYGAYSQGAGYGRPGDGPRSPFGRDDYRNDGPRGGRANVGGYAPADHERPADYRDDRRGAYDDRVDPPASALRQAGRDNDRFDNRDQDRRVAIDETNELIASNKVEGTRVYNRRGERLGTIANFMVGKRSGKVEYAVMTFGGFLGLGERYYPLPWSVLRYDEELGGYRINIEGDERSLRHAPSFRSGEEPRWDRAFGQHVYGFYGVTY